MIPALLFAQVAAAAEPGAVPTKTESVPATCVEAKSVLTTMVAAAERKIGSFRVQSEDAYVRTVLDEMLAELHCVVGDGRIGPTQAVEIHVAFALDRSEDEGDAATAEARASLGAAKGLSPWLPASLDGTWPADEFATLTPATPTTPAPVADGFAVLIDGVWTNVYDPRRAAIVQLLKRPAVPPAKPLQRPAPAPDISTWPVDATEYVWTDDGLRAFLGAHGALAPSAPLPAGTAAPTPTPTPESGGSPHAL